jgi:hypothetical protein
VNKCVFEEKLPSVSELNEDRWFTGSKYCQLLSSMVGFNCPIGILCDSQWFKLFYFVARNGQKILYSHPTTSTRSMTFLIVLSAVIYMLPAR